MPKFERKVVERVMGWDAEFVAFGVLGHDVGGGGVKKGCGRGVGGQSRSRIIL